MARKAVCSVLGPDACVECCSLDWSVVTLGLSFSANPVPGASVSWINCGRFGPDPGADAAEASQAHVNDCCCVWLVSCIQADSPKQRVILQGLVSEVDSGTL